MYNEDESNINKLSEELIGFQNQSFSDAEYLVQLYKPYLEDFLSKKQFSSTEVEVFINTLSNEDGISMFASLYMATHNTLLSKGYDVASIIYQMLSATRMQKIESNSKLLSEILTQKFSWEKEILRDGLAFLDISNNRQTANLSGRNNSLKEKIFNVGKRKGPPVDIKILLPIGTKITLLEEIGKKDKIWVSNFGTLDEPTALLSKEKYIWNSELEVIEVSPFKLKCKHIISNMIIPLSPLVLTTPIGIRVSYS